MNEKPNWNRGDKLHSLRDVISLGRVAVAELIARLDTKYADSINGEDDNS